MPFLNQLLTSLVKLSMSLVFIICVMCQNVLAIEAKPSADGFVIALVGQRKALNSALINNQFNRPLVLKSTESSDDLKGEIYVVLDYPFKQVNSAFNNPNHWCDALILHINVKYCRAVNINASKNNAGVVLNINLGKKYDQPLVDTYNAKFNYESITSAANYFSVEMKAADGPLGTKDYRIWLEATPLENNQTFLHFTYAYSFGLTGKLAMKGYLATIGKDKVGFSRQSTSQNGQLDFVQGLRGVVERNTMRYYLAIDAYLAALKDIPENQQEKRFQYWFDSTEQFSLQLHEVERTEYFSMKRKEAERQSIAR